VVGGFLVFYVINYFTITYQPIKLKIFCIIFFEESFQGLSLAKLNNIILYFYVHSEYLIEQKTSLFALGYFSRIFVFNLKFINFLIGFCLILILILIV